MMNTYQEKVLSWRGSYVRVEFISKNPETIEGELIDADIHSHKFIIRTADGQDILVMGAVKKITRLGYLEEDLFNCRDAPVEVLRGDEP